MECVCEYKSDIFVFMCVIVIVLVLALMLVLMLVFVCLRVCFCLLEYRNNQSIRFCVVYFEQMRSAANCHKKRRIEYGKINTKQNILYPFCVSLMKESVYPPPYTF